MKWLVIVFFHTKKIIERTKLLNWYTLLKWDVFNIKCYNQYSLRKFPSLRLMSLHEICMYLYVISLIWWPFLSASHYSCLYLAVCLPSAELPIDHLWVNIQELRTLCLINIGAWAELWLEQIPGHIYPEAFLLTPPPHPHWVPGGIEETSVTGKWLQLWFCWCFCNLLHTQV